MSHELLGLVGLGLLFVAIFIGFPIAFTLGALALITGLIALGPVVLDLAVLQTFSVMQDRKVKHHRAQGNKARDQCERS